MTNTPSQNKLATTDAESLAAIVTRKADALERYKEMAGRTTLADFEGVQYASTLYLRDCAETGVLPTMTGLANALGVTRMALYDYQKRNPESRTTVWLAHFSDQCSEALAEAALTGKVQPVVAIFVEKARYGWRDAVTIETYQQQAPLGTLTTSDELADKYEEIYDEEGNA